MARPTQPFSPVHVNLNSKCQKFICLKLQITALAATSADSSQVPSATAAATTTTHSQRGGKATINSTSIKSSRPRSKREPTAAPRESRVPASLLHGCLSAPTGCTFIWQLSWQISRQQILSTCDAVTHRESGSVGALPSACCCWLCCCQRHRHRQGCYLLHVPHISKPSTLFSPTQKKVLQVQRSRNYDKSIAGINFALVWEPVQQAVPESWSSSPVPARVESDVMTFVCCEIKRRIKLNDAPGRWLKVPVTQRPPQPLEALGNHTNTHTHTHP